MNTEREESSGERQTYVLLTDIHRSTTLWEQYPYEFSDALEKHNAIVENAVEAHGGEIMKNLGDGYIALFRSAPACVATMVDVKRGIGTLPALPDGTQVRVRMVAHGGMLQRLAAGRGYFGEPLNRASRICQICHPGQVLMSEVVRKRLGKPPDGAELVDLGLHHLRDLSEPEHLFQLVHPDFQVQEFPPLPTLAYRPNNLVAQPNSFVGREKELADLNALLRGGKHRLITITSPGGYGKTRLAVQLLADVLDDYPNGVFQVLLAPVGDDSRIASATADALRFRFYGRADPKQQLLDYLREKQMLICFDNFEHLKEGAPLLTDITAQAPGVKMLVTSREPLRLQGEKLYRLEPLPVTGDGEAAPEISDAAKLFIDRASLVKQDFALTNESLAGARAICEMLDGVPLSIEMAAAWADNFTLPELLSEVEQRLELTARLTDVAERHRSVSASLDWSYSLLSDEQRGILRSVATFKGGFYPEAAKAVVSTKSLRRMLAELCDKGWLYSREVAAKTRFFIRDAASHEYAFEKLKNSDDFEPAVIAHCRCFGDLCDVQCERLHGKGQKESHKVMSLELENIYEALDTALNRTDPALLLPIARSLRTFLCLVSEFQEGLKRYERIVAWAEVNRDVHVLMHGLYGKGGFLDRLAHYREAEEALAAARRLGQEADDSQFVSDCVNELAAVATMEDRPADARRLLSEALAMVAQPQLSRYRADILRNLGTVELMSGNLRAARDCYDESLKILRDVGDPLDIAGGLNSLANIERDEGNFAGAKSLFTEALAVFREFGDRRGAAIALLNLGIVLCQSGDVASARDSFRESLEIAREIGDRRGAARALMSLGIVQYESSDVASARESYRESLEISREIGDLSNVAAVLVNLGNLQCLSGDVASARDFFREALEVAKKIDNAHVTAHSLNGLGVVAQMDGDLDAARSFLAQALALFSEIGVGGGALGVLANLGNLATAQADYAEAASRLHEALETAAEVRELGGHERRAPGGFRALRSTGKASRSVRCQVRRSPHSAAVWTRLLAHRSRPHHEGGRENRRGGRGGCALQGGG